MPTHHSATSKAPRIRSKKYWFVLSGILFLALAGILMMSGSDFGLLNFSITLLLVMAITPVLYKRPVSTGRRILYFQLILLLALYPVKGLNIFWMLNFENFENLPNPIRNGVLATNVSLAFQISCFVIALLALLLHFTPNKQKLEIFFQQRRLNVQALIFLTLSIFFVSLLLRFMQVSGTLGAIIYVVNHRGTPFAFALLIYLLIESGNQKLASRMFVLWMTLGLMMFIIFGSKSYIFLPIIFIYSTYLFSEKLVLNILSILLITFSFIALYPILNIYRSSQISSGDGADIFELYALASLHSFISSGASWTDTFYLYLNQVLDRFIGIEWLLVILEAESSRFLPEGLGPLQNASAVNDTMRYISGVQGEAIGIAPSFIGFSYLITRNPIAAVFLAVSICAAFIWINRIFSQLFPRLGSAIIAPLSLIIFSILTDGAIMSLYWDLPALMLICFTFNFVIKNKIHVRDGTYISRNT